MFLLWYFSTSLLAVAGDSSKYLASLKYFDMFKILFDESDFKLTSPSSVHITPSLLRVKLISELILRDKWNASAGVLQFLNGFLGRLAVP